MINPYTQTGKDLAHVAEHLAVWPMNTDFIHVKSGVIHMIEGGSSSVVSYISREQWAAAKSLHQYWFPEKQPKPEGFCDVCSDTHCVHELYPGICAEYDGGMVSLDLAKAIYNGDFRPENAEEGGMNHELRWLAENINSWLEPSEYIGRMNNNAYWGRERCFLCEFSREQWQEARDQLEEERLYAQTQTESSVIATEDEEEEWERLGEKQAKTPSIAERYLQYYKDVRSLDYVDVYQVHRLFGIDDSSGCIQHASKKLLLSGARTGGKPKRKDIEEARDTLTRWLEIQDGRLEVEKGR